MDGIMKKPRSAMKRYKSRIKADKKQIHLKKVQKERNKQTNKQPNKKTSRNRCNKMESKRLSLFHKEQLKKEN